MFIKQISIFVENTPGRVISIIRTLEAQNIDIRALSLSDTSDFGILRLIVSNVDLAREVLSANGLVSSVTPVLAVALDDTPDSLARAIKVLYDGGINVEYMYAFISPQPYACMILRVTDNKRAEQILVENAFKLISMEDINQM